MRSLFNSLLTVLLISLPLSSGIAQEPVAIEEVNPGSDGVPMAIQRTYIDVHSGPGRGYPIFHTLERNEEIHVHKSRTDWFKVETLDRYQPVTGWVHRDDLNGSMLADGSLADLSIKSWDELGDRRWTLSGRMGDLDGAQSLDMSLGYRITTNLQMEATYGEATGDFSDIQYGYLKLTSYFRPIWRLTPYFSVGAGTFRTNPNTKLVQSEQRNEASMLAGLGLRTYLTRSFFMHLEYNQHLVLTDRDANEEVEQWTFGLSVSF